MAEPLHLRKGVTGTIVRVHPLVLFTICDSYIRRGENMTSVIGTLLGVVQDNVVTINNCYSVPHSDNSETVQVDVVHNKTMFDLHQRVNPKEIIVGWFSTGLEISASDALLHDFYNNRQSGSTVKTPVHLRVDTALTEGRMSIKAYVSRQLSLRDKPLATEFLEVPCSCMMEEAESLGLDVLRASSAQTLAADQQHLEAAFRKLKDMLERAEQYVDSVLEGRRKGDVRIGRYLADMLSVVPHMGKAEFQKMFNDSVQDVLLVVYLSSMVRSHIALADRLGTSALPLL